MQPENTAALLQPMRPLPHSVSVTAYTEAPFSLPLLIWLLGMLLLTVYFAATYMLCRREFQMALPIQNDRCAAWIAHRKIKRPITLRQSSRIAAPLTYGVWNPVILMPKNTDWENAQQIDYILAHELVHIARFDTVIKLFLTASLCIHWFNPLVWAMYFLSNRDMELSCDEAVIRAFGDASKSDYARTLIRMEENKSRLTPFCIHFSKTAIEERITAIMKIRKPSVAALTAAVLLVGGVTTVFATSAKAESSPAPQAYATNTIIAQPAQAELDNQPQATSDAQGVSGTYEQGFPIDDLDAQKKLLEQYGKFGMSFDSDGTMLYDGALVRYFCDGVEQEAGAWGIRYQYLNAKGTVDVFTKRTVIDLGNGGKDPFGALVGLEKSSQAEFAQRDISNFSASSEQTTFAQSNATIAGGMTFADKFSKYAPYGISYSEEHAGSGSGNVYLNGVLVKFFIDETQSGGVFSYASKDGGAITAQTVYDSAGNLTGIKKK